MGEARSGPARTAEPAWAAPGRRERENRAVPCAPALQASGSDSPTRPAPGSPGPGAPAWKRTLALLALVLSAWLWVGGLVDSLSRPSVVDSLSLRQLELATLAGEALPAELRMALTGENPRAELAQELERQIQATPLPAPAAQRLELILLRRGDAAGSAAQEQALSTMLQQVDAERRPLLAALLEGRRLSPTEQARLLVL